MSLIRLLQLRFMPFSPDLGLLVLRVWFGIGLLTLHGWGKLANFAERAGRFSDPLGVGSPVSLALATFGEVFCSSLVVLGFCTRFGAIGAGAVPLVAFYFVHGTTLSGPRNGELALMYLGAFVTIFLAGPGRYSVDARLGGAR